MAVPDFQSVLLPLLRLAADGQEHTLAEAISSLANEFRLSDEDRAEMLPGGGQRRFKNRVYWAKTHLRGAGLVESPTRGRYRLTSEGNAVLAAPPTKVDMNFSQEVPSLCRLSVRSRLLRNRRPCSADHRAPNTRRHHLVGGEAARRQARPGSPCSGRGCAI